MAYITRAQREAIQKIYYRGPIYQNGKTSPEIAMAAGWRFIEVASASERIKSKVTNPQMTHVWIHDKVSPIYAESDDLVKDYQLADEVRYREFRKSVQHGFDCLMVKWCGMWLGIEPDGYTHS